MWSEGTTHGYKYWIKHYEEGSDSGINGGKISKLTIRKIGESRDLANYDRGWDALPKDAEVKAVYRKILKQYN
jgi:hypothetical protein